MKQPIALLVLLMTYVSVQAQFYGKPFYQFPIDTLVKDTCKLTPVEKYKNLDVYCTTNDKWNGPRDTSVCTWAFDITGNTYENVIALRPEHEDRMIWFVDTTIDIPFIKDSVLRYLDFSFRRNCRIKENERWLLVENFDTAKGQYFIDTIALESTSEHCYCGNKYYRNIKGLIVGAKPWDITTGAYMVSAAALAYQNKVKIVSDSLVANSVYNDSTQAYDVFFKDSTYVFADPDTNKFKNQIHTIIFEPQRPVDKRQIINAFFYTGTFIQPGVEVKGGMWDSTTNTRHKLNFEIDEGNLCLVSIIDLVIKGDDKVTFNGGKVNHGSQRACMMFEEKAELVIAKNSHLLYGSAGKGMLGIKPGARLVLEDSATLTINNTLALLDYWDNQQGGIISVALKPGNKLVFGPNAVVTDGPFEHGSIKLNVYMKGGELDLSNLDSRSRELINVIEETPAFILRDLANAKAFPNPTIGNFIIPFKSDTTTQLTWQLFKTNGAQMQNGEFDVLKGSNELNIDLSQNRSGVYLLSVRYLGEKYYYKVILTKGL